MCFCLIFLDVDLLICKHKGPSCCTRKTEESYQVAVKRETLQNVQSYSYEPKHLFSTHANAFQGKFFDREGQARLGRPWDTELLKDKLWFNGLPWSNFWHVVLSLTEAREYPTDSAFILGQWRKKSFKFPFLQLFLIIWVKKIVPWNHGSWHWGKTSSKSSMPFFPLWVWQQHLKKGHRG